MNLLISLFRSSLLFGAGFALAACSSEDQAPLGTSAQAFGVCASGVHECSGWGATCAGSELETCVVGADGCRTILRQTCSRGCAEGACTSCESLSAPLRSVSLATPTAFYESLARRGNTVIASWRGRNGIYTLPQRGFTAVDVTDPNAVRELGTTALPDNQSALTLELEGNTLFGLVPGSRIQTWDVATPAALTPRGGYTPALAPTALAVRGNVVYVGTNTGLEIVDFSNVDAPQLVGLMSTTVAVLALATSGTRVAVAGLNGIEVIDVSNPALPTRLARAPLSGAIYSRFARPLAFDGDRLAVATSGPQTSDGFDLTQGIELFAFTAPGALARRGTFGRLGYVTKVAFDGNELRVLDGGSLATLDVSALDAPKWNQTVSAGGPDGGVTDVVRDGPLLYTTGTQGVGAVDLRQAGLVSLRQTAPNSSSNTSTAGLDTLRGVVTHGSLAYLARASTGLAIEDLRDPQRPITLSNTPLAATGIALHGGLAYVGVKDEGLTLFDVRSPWAPVRISSVKAPVVGAVEVHQGRVYAMCAWAKACVFDVRDPARPSLLGEGRIPVPWGTSQDGPAVVLRGSHVLLPSADMLYAIDLSTPGAPAVVSQVAVGGYSSGSVLAVRGDAAYVAYDCHTVAGDTCIDVFDVSAPSNLRKLTSVAFEFGLRGGFYGTRGEARRSSMHIVGRHLFISNQWGGVMALDIGDPLRIIPKGNLWTALPARNLFGMDRFMTVHTQTAFPLPGPAMAQDQTLELCQ